MSVFFFEVNVGCPRDARIHTLHTCFGPDSGSAITGNIIHDTIAHGHSFVACIMDGT